MWMGRCASETWENIRTAICKRSWRSGLGNASATLSKDDRLRDMQERVDEYLNFGVPNVWILDPVLRKAWVCTSSGFQEPADGILHAAGSTIHLPLAEIFAELDL